MVKCYMASDYMGWSLKRSVDLMTLAKVISVEPGHGLNNELETRSGGS